MYAILEWPTDPLALCMSVMTFAPTSGSLDPACSGSLLFAMPISVDVDTGDATEDDLLVVPKVELFHDISLIRCAALDLQLNAISRSSGVFESVPNSVERGQLRKISKHRH